MKKKMLVLLCCLLVCPLLTLGALGAEKGKMTLSGNTEDLKRGDEIELEVELNRNPGIKTLRAAIEYDPMVLEFVSAEGTGPLPGYSFDDAEGELLLRWQRNGEGMDLTATGKVARVVLRVKENAIFGDSAIRLSISQKLYDAQNNRGEAVPFDTQGLNFTLVCPHENPVFSVVQEATFETEGIAKKVCPDCGVETQMPLYPTLTSEDGKVEATLAVGEYLDSDEKSVRVEYLYGGEEAASAKTLFGESMIRAFRFHFTKGQGAYFPSRECTLRLKTDFTLPDGFVLYALLDGGAEQLEFEKEEDTLEFLYRDMVYVLVARDTEAEPMIPDETTTTATKASTTTKSPEETARQRDLLLISAGGVVLVLCGVGMILLLSKRKRY